MDITDGDITARAITAEKKIELRSIKMVNAADTTTRQADTYYDAMAAPQHEPTPGVYILQKPASHMDGRFGDIF